MFSGISSNLNVGYDHIIQSETNFKKIIYDEGDKLFFRASQQKISLITEDKNKVQME